jgi:predicted nucleic acid-binding protein
VKLLIDEPGSATAQHLWSTSTRTICSRLLYPEARAALAAAGRAGRVAPVEHIQAQERLEAFWQAIDRLGVRTRLARRAGDLADEQGLRGYDAVHLASFETIASDATVLVTFDADLRRAALALGYPVAPSSR